MERTKTEQLKAIQPAGKRRASNREPHKAACPPKPVLRFSPTAWAKLLFFRDRGPVEVGGFGITESDDLLHVVDFVTVKQNVSAVTVEFEDAAVADFFEDQVDAGRRPEQFARVWLHSHPGMSPTPSRTDEETFGRVFGSCEWAVMFVVGQNDRTYARLRFNTGPGGSMDLPVEVDFKPPFAASDQDAWEKEYEQNIHATEGIFGSTGRVDLAEEFYDYSYPQDWIEELETMDRDQRQRVLAELAGRPDLWSESEGAHHD